MHCVATSAQQMMPIGQWLALCYQFIRTAFGKPLYRIYILHIESDTVIDLLLTMFVITAATTIDIQQLAGRWLKGSEK